jgi:hypothetical protein
MLPDRFSVVNVIYSKRVPGTFRGSLEKLELSFKFRANEDSFCEYLVDPDIVWKTIFQLTLPES